MLLDMRSRELHALSGAGSVYQIEWVAPQTPAWLRTGPEEDAIAQI